MMEHLVLQTSGGPSKVMRAIEDFIAKSSQEVNFNKGDRLQIIEDYDENEVVLWLQARNLRSQEVGYIPARLVTEDNSQQAQTDDIWKQVDTNEKKKMKQLKKKQKSQPESPQTGNVKGSVPLQTSPVTAGQIVLKALQDYEAKSVYEVSFIKGDELVPIEEFAESENQIWLQVRNLRTQEDGYIPVKYVSAKGTSENTQKSYDGYSGKEDTDFTKMREKHDKQNINPPKRKKKHTSIKTLKGDRVIMRAMYQFTPRDNDELAFLKGDRLLIIEDYQGINQDWYEARNMRNLEEGLIPMNYVITEEPITTQAWYFDVTREEANTRLLNRGLGKGTFLIRKSKDEKNYVLSLRDLDEAKKVNRIRHYMIYVKISGDVFIRDDRVFSDLCQLVEYYKANADILCFRLVGACPKSISDVSMKDYEVQMESITKKDKIATGWCTDIYKGTWRNIKWRTDVDVAVSVLRQRTIPLSEFLHQAKFMISMRHVNILETLAVCTEAEPYCIVTELMKESLLQYLRREDVGQSLTLAEMVHMASQIASGMEFLDRRNYVMRELATRNVLVQVVGGKHIVKLSYFKRVCQTIAGEDGGRFYQLSENEKMAIKWTASEVFRSLRWTIKGDVWSFGILLHEIFSYGRMPYPGMKNTEVLEAVEKGYRMPKPRGGRFDVPDSAYDIMLKCWDASPEKRPTFEYLHSFFEDYLVNTEPQLR